MAVNTIGAGVILNEGQIDVDFRVEGNSNANVLMVDGSTDRVGIGVAAPANILDIQKSSIAGAGAADDFIQIKRTDTTSVLNRNTGILFTDSNTEGSAIRNIRTNYAVNYQNDLAFSTNVAGSDNSLSEVMRITGTGNVGIGVSTLEANGGITSRLQVEGTGGDTSSLSIFRNSTNAFGPYFTLGKSKGAGLNSDTAVVDNDILGTIQWSAVDVDDNDRQCVGANIFARVNGSPSENDMPTELVFGTTADGADAITERMYISSSGNVGIGIAAPEEELEVVGDIQFHGNGGGGKRGRLSGDATWMYFEGYEPMYFYTSSGDDIVFAPSGDVGIGTASPSYKLDVMENATGFAARIQNDGANADRFGLLIYAGADDGGGTTSYIQCTDGDGGDVGKIANTSGTFALTDQSDRRLKDNIRDTRFGLDDLNKIQVRDFELKKSGDSLTGFIAQELKPIFPQAVVGSENDVYEDGNPEYMGVSRDVLVPLLVKAIQELSAKVEALENA